MRSVLIGLVIGFVWAGLVRPGRGQEGEPVTAEQVREAIDGAIQFLKSQQQRGGAWADWVGNTHPGGVTSLCTLALLNAGVEPSDESIQRALVALRRIEPESTYVVALQTMVFARAEPERDLPLIGRNVSWLEKTQIQEGPSKGAWAYPGLNGDNSNSQFALLALHDADRAGARVDRRTWLLAKAYWERTQNPDGSWGYRPGMPGTGSMTCAGISSMIIATDIVAESTATVEGDRIDCCGQADASDDPIEKGLRWLGDHFSVTHNPASNNWLLYYLYGLERVGRLSARRFIGQHDWYREGAQHLIGMRGDLVLTGGWKGVGPEANDENVSTSLALLFLAKGRWPILMGKLRHGEADDWNQHPSDINNLTRYVESRWRRDLTWQVVGLAEATVEDLLESPVLYFAGRANPLPADPAAQQSMARKLRDYVDRGGFLLAEAYCGGQPFDAGFRQLMRLAFPEPEYGLALLPPEHPIWRAEEQVPAAELRPLMGIEFGCRTSVVYVPPEEPGRASLSCLWELSRAGRDRSYSAPVKRQVGAGLSIGINVLAYATNRELRFKDVAVARSAEHGAGQLARGRVHIANLRHPGGCDAAPRALSNLMQAAADELNVRTSTEQQKISITDPEIFDYHLVFMHGRNSFRLTEAEQAQLRTYVERGGMIFANSICASRSFTESFRREMQQVFPDKPLEPVAVDDPLLTPRYGGFDLKTVTRRDPQRTDPKEPLKGLLRQVPPELEGIRVNGRLAVIFSRFDLSCALEKQDSLECQGYTREDAGRIGLNVLLYSLQQ
jgi:hypothetical protein